MRLPWEELEPASRSTIERQRRAVQRLERLTDGIFSAAVIALFILPALPYLTGVADAPTLREALSQVYPSLLLHALSILVLFVVWTLHHYEFQYFTRSTGVLVWLNALLLAIVAAVPVCTALLDGFASDGVPVVLYAVDLLALQLLLIFIWRHAVGAGLLFGSDVPSRAVERMRLALRSGAAALVLVAALAPFLPRLSLALTAALYLFYAVLTARGGPTLDLGKSRSPAQGF